MTEPWLAALRQRALAPVDAASSAAFRVTFGLLGCWGSLRFLLYGWVDRFYVQPDFTFKYWGFEWVALLPPWAMYAAFVALVILSLMIAAGLFYRAAIIGFFLLFTYVELIDVTNYLNHYYLVSLLAFVMCWLPLGRAWSLDARRRPERALQSVPAWVVWALRGQVGLVYFFAGLAKLGEDWLIYAQPLNLWLAARVDLPLIGAWLRPWWVALAMSWAGFLFDTTIPLWLSWRRARPWAWAVVVVFHVGTHLLFTIGLFPLIMVSSALIFFEPSWPRRWLPASLRQPPTLPRQPHGASPRLAWAALGALALFELAMPLRAHLYAQNGPVTWHEQGMRWSWRVMVREKNGSVSYRVRLPGESRERVIPPSRYLTAHQEREMSGQPDLILQLGHHIARELARQGRGAAQVRVDALVSLNGRPPARLIDPDVDLATIPDGIALAPWILPAPEIPPPRLRASK